MSGERRPADRPTDRVVVGAHDDDVDARLNARALLMSGCEVVFVGGGQSVDQMVSTTIAEDAVRVVYDAEQTELDALHRALTDAERPDVKVEICGE